MASHLHCFTVGDSRYGTDPEGDLGMRPETRYALAAVAGPGQQFLYEYDFGDGWDHLVTIVTEEDAEPGLKHAVCLDGARACPPDDCGGPGGYDELLAILDDPSAPDYEYYRSWIGGSYDPEAFSLAAVNASLQNLCA